MHPDRPSRPEEPRESGPALPIEPPVPLADNELIENLQDGDLDALDPLLDRHLPALRGFLAIQALDLPSLDQLTQETVILALRRIRHFGGNSFQGWLRAMGWNLLRAEIQRFRRAENQQSRFIQQQLSVDRSRGGGPGNRASEALGLWYEEQSESIQEVLTLKFRHGLSNQEIAQKLKQSAASVDQALLRLRRQIPAGQIETGPPADPTLIDWLEGGLNEKQRAAFEERCANDSEAMQLAATQRRLDLIFRVLLESPAAMQRVKTSILVSIKGPAAEPPQPAQPVVEPAARSFPWKLILGAALIGLLFLLGLLVWR